MTILDTIVEHKRMEILKRKRKWSVSDFEKFELFERTPLKIDPEDSKKNPGIIAEFKRRSPSKGIINAEADVVKVSKIIADSNDEEVNEQNTSNY